MNRHQRNYVPMDIDDVGYTQTKYFCMNAFGTRLDYNQLNELSKEFFFRYILINIF